MSAVVEPSKRGAGGFVKLARKIILMRMAAFLGLQVTLVPGPT
jgi:hypothetical protein